MVTERFFQKSLGQPSEDEGGAGRPLSLLLLLLLLLLPGILRLREDILRLTLLAWKQNTIKDTKGQ